MEDVVVTKSQQYRKTQSTHFSNYPEAAAASQRQSLGKNQRVRVRRRAEGFDVVVYTRLPEKE